MVATLRHRHNPSQPILTAARKQASRRDTDSRAAMDSSKAVSNTVDISRHKVVISNFGVLWYLTFLLGWVVGIVGLVGWIVLMINGFQGKYFKLPIVGDYAEKYANQGVAGM